MPIVQPIQPDENTALGARQRARQTIRDKALAMSRRRFDENGREIKPDPDDDPPPAVPAAA